MNAQKFTQKLLEAIQDAQDIAIQNRNMQIDQEHLLYALADQEGARQRTGESLYISGCRPSIGRC